MCCAIRWLCVQCMHDVPDKSDMHIRAFIEHHANASAAKQHGSTWVALHALLAAVLDTQWWHYFLFLRAQESHASALAEERERGAAAAAQTAEQLAAAQVGLTASHISGQPLAQDPYVVL